MLVAAVARVDDGHVRAVGGDAGRALLRVAHDGDVRIAGDGADGVRDALTLGDGAGVRLREADHLAAQAQHRRLKAKARAGARFVEQRCEQLAVAGMGKTRRVRDDLVRQVEDLLQFGGGHVHRFEDAFPFQHVDLLSKCRAEFTQKKSSLKSKGRFCNKRERMGKVGQAARKAIAPRHGFDPPPHAVPLLF